MHYRKIIGDNIRVFRHAKGWTQEKLAIRSKVSYEYINRVENGRVNISIDTLLRISKCLKVPFAELTKGVE